MIDSPLFQLIANAPAAGLLAFLVLLLYAFQRGILVSGQALDAERQNAREWRTLAIDTSSQAERLEAVAIALRARLAAAERKPLGCEFCGRPTQPTVDGNCAGCGAPTCPAAALAQVVASRLCDHQWLDTSTHGEGWSRFCPRCKSTERGEYDVTTFDFGEGILVPNFQVRVRG